jgi:hypothetical protein
MKTIVWCWNLLHWYNYLWHVEGFKLLFYFDPMKLIRKIPAVSRILLNSWAKRGVTNFKELDQVVNQRMNDPVTGFNIIATSGSILILGIFVEMIFFNLINVFMGKYLWKLLFDGPKWFALWILILPLLFNHFTIFRHDRYLNYFKEFDKFSKEKRLKYGWICFGVAFMMIVVACISTYYVANEMK